MKLDDLNNSTLLNQLSQEELLQLIGQLPSDYQLIFKLRAFEGSSYKEIAELLTISEKEVLSSYLLARSFLLKKLTKKTNIPVQEDTVEHFFQTSFEGFEMKVNDKIW